MTLEKVFLFQNTTFFIWDKYGNLSLCLRLVQPNFHDLGPPCRIIILATPSMSGQRVRARYGERIVPWTDLNDVFVGQRLMRLVVFCVLQKHFVHVRWGVLKWSRRQSVIINSSIIEMKDFKPNDISIRLKRWSINLSLFQWVTKVSLTYLKCSSRLDIMSWNNQGLQVP